MIKGAYTIVEQMQVALELWRRDISSHFERSGTETDIEELRLTGSRTFKYSEVDSFLYLNC